VDIWESTRQDTERLKADKHALLEQMLDTLHSQDAMASFYSDSAKHGYTPTAVTSTGVLGNGTHSVTEVTVVAEGSVISRSSVQRAALHVNTDLHSDAGSEHTQGDHRLHDDSPAVSVGAASSVDHGYSGSDRLITSVNTAAKISRPRRRTDSGDHSVASACSVPEAAVPTTAPAAASEREETLTLLSETAKSIEGISALTSAHHSSSDLQIHAAAEGVPLLPLQATAFNGIADSMDPDNSYSARASRQAARDFIENDPLDEDDVHRLWDEAFTHPSALASTQGSTYADGLHVGSPDRPVAAWLRRVAPAKRYPTATEHLVGITIVGQTEHKYKKTLRAPRKESPNSRPQTGDTHTHDAFAPALKRSVTTELLVRDIKPINQSASNVIGPPILMHDKTSDAALQEMRRSLTLPHIAGASKFDRFEASAGDPFEPLNEMPAGLEVTEDGLVLKDPLLAKKFTAQRKALVANATKAAAALRRASNELERAKSSAVMRHTHAGGDQGDALSGSGAGNVNRKASVAKHSLSANLIGQSAVRR
jgi:hypothetical protein